MSESTYVKMPHCCKSHATAHLCFGFSQHIPPDHFSIKKTGLDFRVVLQKILYLSVQESKNAWMTFFDGILQPACHETESVLLVSASYTIDASETYECSISIFGMGYEDLRCLHMAIRNKTNTPEETNLDFLYLFLN